MKKVDMGAYSAKQPTRIKPEAVDLGDLPPIQAPSPKQKPADVQKHDGAIAQTHKGTDAPSHESTEAHRHERANVHDYRPIVRKTLDVFLDQIEMMDTWRARKRREGGGRSVTQGEVVREILDFFKQAHDL